MRARRTSTAIRLAAAVSVASLAAACGSGPSANSPGAVRVVASFYPLQFVAEQVGGDRVDVANLTPAGSEPHDIEITGEDAAALEDADLVVYLAGFSPALDEAIATVSVANALDVTSSARLDVAAGGRVDPHFWLDPLRLADVADAVAEELSRVDPAGAAAFVSNAATLRADLEALDGEFAAGLADCASTDIVTSHSAFAYLADRYGLSQVGVSGLLPEEEPSPSDLAAVTEYVRAHHVRTIFSETLVDPGVAEAVASETGAATAVLDPIEGLTGASQGTDYRDVMRANLASLRIGLGCS
jgi:zinc transport system substrate-binding protein